jgi:hypothetical protein
MTSKVIDTNEISLNGVYYPITRPIRSTLASIYPAKVVIGDTSKDDQLRSSIIAWADWRGGIGVNRMEGAGDVSRAWFSTCQLRYKNHLVLPNLATATATPSHSLGQATIGAIETFANEIYAFWNGGAAAPELYKYANASNSWGTKKTTANITDEVTDSVVFTNSVDSYLVFAHYDSGGSGYSYSTDGDSWTTDTTYGAQFLTVWDERLWGISYQGQLWYATYVGTEYTDAKLPTPDGSVTALFVARNAMGVPVIYAATTEGLFAHNSDNAMWEATQFTFPIHPDNGKGSTRWRDAVYIPSGNGIYSYVNGSNAAVVTVVGPDRDDGMPSDKRGAIRSMAGSHNELLAGLDAQVGADPVSFDAIPRLWQSHTGSHVIAGDKGFSTILGYNELGWETKWIAGEKGTTFDTMHVSSAYNKYRLWWGANGVVYFMDLPKDVINPSEVDDLAYGLSGIHETPWFNAGQSEVDKLALNLRIECQDLSTTEKVKVEYATDYVESYTEATATLDSPTMFAQVGGSVSKTTLDGAISSTSATSVPVDDADGLVVGDFIIVDSEHMTITAISSDTLTVTRASNSTTAATHADEAAVAIGGSAGTYRYTFASGVGTKFRAIKFKLTLSRSSGDTTGLEKFETPDVVSLTMEWRKKLTAKWGHTAEVDLNRAYRGKEPKDLRAALITAIESTTLVEFTFRDDSGGTRNYYVDVTAAVGMEYTGRDERGTTQVSVVEP